MTNLNCAQLRSTALIICLLLFLTSCQKDLTVNSLPEQGNEVNLEQKISTPIFAPQEPTNDKAVFDKINAFASRMRALESGKESLQTNEMSANDVVWNVEALLNARYAAGDKPFKRSISETFSIRIHRNDNNMVSENDLPAAIEAIRQKLARHWRNTTEENKHIVLVDINISQVESLDLILSVTDVIGIGPLGIDPFVSTDNWRWGYKEGKCTNTTIRWAADDVLQSAINERYPQSAWLGFFTDIDPVSFYAWQRPNPNDVTPNDNKRDYLAFHDTEQYPNFVSARCISFNDMNWYYNNYFNEIATQKALLHKDFSHIKVEGDIHFHREDGVDHTVDFHQSTIKLGVFHRSGCRYICEPDLMCEVVCLQPL